MRWPMTTIPLENGKMTEAQAPFIISASRSTDIPAFYADWFFHRLKVGYCAWINPFNNKKLYVSFANCRFIVFWSKNPRPLLKHLDILKDRKIGCYIQFTLNNYEKEGYEKGVHPLQDRLDTFKELSHRLGKANVIWRFDPLVLSSSITPNELLDRIEYMGDQLFGFTEKLVFSFVDINSYRKVAQNLTPIHAREWTEDEMQSFASSLEKLNQKWKFTLATCGEKVNLSKYGIQHNHCIDENLIIRSKYEDTSLMDFLNVKVTDTTNKHVTQLSLLAPQHDVAPQVPPQSESVLHITHDGSIYAEKMANKKRSGIRDLKDSGQRESCGCITSKDIGQYDTCPHQCVYCYANRNIASAIANRKRHLENPLGETIIGL